MSPPGPSCSLEIVDKSGRRVPPREGDPSGTAAQLLEERCSRTGRYPPIPVTRRRIIHHGCRQPGVAAWRAERRVRGGRSRSEGSWGRIGGQRGLPTHHHGALRSDHQIETSPSLTNWLPEHGARRAGTERRGWGHHTKCRGHRLRGPSWWVKVAVVHRTHAFRPGQRARQGRQPLSTTEVLRYLGRHFESFEPALQSRIRRERPRVCERSSSKWWIEHYWAGLTGTGAPGPSRRFVSEVIDDMGRAPDSSTQE
jgi:hypothetical protein